MRKKCVVKIITSLFLGFLLCPLVLASPIEQPELYRKQSRFFNFSSNHSQFGLIKYPKSDQSSNLATGDSVYRLDLSKKSTGLGFYSPIYQEDNHMDGFLYEFKIAADFSDRPMFFYINYIDDQNNQIFSCEHGLCIFQQKINGQELYQNLPTSSQAIPKNMLSQNNLVKIYTSKSEASIVICPYVSGDYNCGLGSFLAVETKPNHNATQMGDLVFFNYWPSRYEIPSEKFSQYYYSPVTVTGYQLSSDLISRVYRQNDYRWSEDQLGDSSYTIGSHGCLVTAASMVLNYWGYDYNHIYGEALTPESLNKWLKDQVDGYLPDGVLNWMALTRFVKLNQKEILASEGKDLPSLEFESFEDNTAWNAFVEDLEANHPSIYRLNQVGGEGYHFAVGINRPGFDFDNPTDYRIADPYYSIDNYLTARTDTVGQINGVRRLQPSHTDLSYFLFYSQSPDLKIRLTNTLGSNLEIEASMFTDKISDPQLGVEQIPLYEYVIRQPLSDQYLLEVENRSLITSSFKAAFYDIDGNLKLWDIDDRLIGAGEKKFYNLNFNKDIGTESNNQFASLIETTNPNSDNFMNWAEIENQLELAHSNKLIMSFLYHYLIEIIAEARNFERTYSDKISQAQSAYRYFVLKVLNNYHDLSLPFYENSQKRPFLSEELYQMLIKELNNTD